MMTEQEISEARSFVLAAGYELWHDDGEYADYEQYEDIDPEAHYNKRITLNTYSKPYGWYAGVEIRADDTDREHDFGCSRTFNHPLPALAWIDHVVRQHQRTCHLSSVTVPYLAT